MDNFFQEIKRLQKLSCIALSHEEEKKLGAQLNDIIGFLGQLPENKVKYEIGKMKNEKKFSLRTINGVKEFSDTKKILQNIKHPIINNSIVIKSVLN